MKREHPLRTLLGLKQEDMAMALGISRARWSMFEIGKRDLPLSAQLVLNQMLLALQNQNKNSQHKQEQDTKVQQQLERMLCDVEYKLQYVGRQVAVLNSKQQLQEQSTECWSSLKNDQSGKHACLEHLAPPVRLYGWTRKPLTTEWVVQQHRLELLQFEKQLLESKIKKLADGRSNHDADL